MPIVDFVDTVTTWIDESGNCKHYVGAIVGKRIVDIEWPYPEFPDPQTARAVLSSIDKALPAEVRLQLTISSQPTFGRFFSQSVLFPMCGSESFVGDLQEGFIYRVNEQGLTSANRWYYRQILLSIWPLTWAWVKRVSGWESITQLLR
jgi:hypothetical protein